MQEPPAPDPPSSGAGGQGGGPPIDLSGAPANDQAPAGGPSPEDQAAQAAAERAATVKFLAGKIGELLRSCDPIIRKAELPVPPLPELVVEVTVKCWEVTLDKWLPQELADPTEYAEVVACGTSGYQLMLTWWARKRLATKEHEVPAVDGAASSPPPPTPPSSPPPAPPPHANGKPPSTANIFAAASVEPSARPEARS